ncbi:hypothetical protein IC582_011511 [Cucumis melo]
MIVLLRSAPSRYMKGFSGGIVTFSLQKVELSQWLLERSGNRLFPTCQQQQRIEL